MKRFDNISDVPTNRLRKRCGASFARNCAGPVERCGGSTVAGRQSVRRPIAILVQSGRHEKLPPPKREFKLAVPLQTGLGLDLHELRAVRRPWIAGAPA